METIALKLIDEDLHKSVLPHLESTVFHLTTQSAYRQILADGKIKHNRDNKFPLNTNSENSYGRKLGYVCLINLKRKDRGTIDETLSYYYFLEPPWFRRYYKDREESNIVYLILNTKYHHLIIESDEAKGSPGEHVPKTECWIDDHIPIGYIERVVTVDIVRNAPKDPLSYAHHMNNLECQNNKENNR